MDWLALLGSIGGKWADSRLQRGNINAQSEAAISVAHAQAELQAQLAAQQAAAQRQQLQMMLIGGAVLAVGLVIATR